MATVDFFTGFTYKWAQTGNTFAWDDAQYKLGWATVGDTPPTVEQFNRVHQIADEKSNWLYGQLKTVADAKAVTLSAGSLTGLQQVLNAYTPNASYLVRGIVLLAESSATIAGTSDDTAVTPAALATLTSTDARRGLIEIATNAEVQAGADALRAVTPSGLASLTGNTSRAGLLELATTAETTTGTDTDRAVTAAGLAAQFPIRGHQIYNAAGAYTWNVPSGVTRVRVIVTGGGGGGGGALGNPTKGAVGGGGGGGSTSVKLVNLAGASTVSVTVGAGGAGGIANNAGVAGAASSFGAFTSASGGLGGQQGVDESGAGGGGSATAPGSDFSVVGGAGVSGRVRDGVYAMAGVGGASLLGDCYSSVNLTGASNAGLNGGVGTNGAGGGGGAAYGATATGGKGGDGIVVIEW